MGRKINGLITGLGSYAPSHRLTNADLEKIVDTSDEWIKTRTGISERRISGEKEYGSDMAVAAAERAMKMAKAHPKDIDLILVGTVTPDYRLPSNACMVQKKMGLINAAALDIAAACAGFINGLSVGNAFIRSGQFKKVLVIGVEKLTSITDYTDRNTCVLFGDGAGAVVLEPTEEDRGVLSTYLKSDGRHAELLWIPDGGTVNPLHKISGRRPRVYVTMKGNEIFKHAVKMMGEASLKALDHAGLTGEDVDLLVPHQANIRIIEATAKRVGIPKKKVFLNISMYGNTSSASVPMALDEAFKTGRIAEGDVILMAAFGGGLTWAAAVVRW